MRPWPRSDDRGPVPRKGAGTRAMSYCRPSSCAKYCEKVWGAAVPNRRRSGGPSFTHWTYSASVRTPIEGETTNAVSKVPTIPSGARSCSGSNGKVAGEVSWPIRVVLGSNPMVVPSGAAFFSDAPIVAPAAPGRFSTVTGRPRRCWMPGVMARATTSEPPPAAKPTQRRTARSGSPDCAKAGVGSRARPPDASTVRRETGVIRLVYTFRRLPMGYALRWQTTQILLPSRSRRYAP